MADKTSRAAAASKASSLFNAFRCSTFVLAGPYDKAISADDPLFYTSGRIFMAALPSKLDAPDGESEGGQQIQKAAIRPHASSNSTSAQEGPGAPA